MQHTVYWAMGAVGMFAVLRECGRTILLIGQGAQMSEVYDVARVLLTMEERETMRAQLGLPTVEEDSGPPTWPGAEQVWDHFTIPPQYRYEEVFGGELPQVAVGEMASQRPPA